jgi:hypothetical protein
MVSVTIDEINKANEENVQKAFKFVLEEITECMKRGQHLVKVQVWLPDFEAGKKVICLLKKEGILTSRKGLDCEKMNDYSSLVTIGPCYLVTEQQIKFENGVYDN